MTMLKLENFINGEFCPPSTGKYILSFNPSTGKESAQVPDSDTQDVQKAYKAAKEAFPIWSKTTRQQRSRLLLKLADLIEENLQELAEQESMDQGKPVQLAKTVDIPRAAYNFRYFAGKLLYLEEKSTVLDDVALNYTQSIPIGVCGLISPWNLPLYLLTWKIAPAIAAGNTCVCKPSELTSLTAYTLCKLIKKSGIPNGVVNIVFGDGPKVGSSIVKHPKIPLISFTGGTLTGEKITRDSAPFHKKLSLELGGKNANIIFDDADWGKCLDTTIRSSFSNQGEICLCGSRIFVHHSVYEKFLQDFKARAEKLIVGDPKDPKTNLGALNSKQHLEKVLSYVQKAKEEGAEIVYGGEILTNIKGVNSEDLSQGYFMLPTIIATKPWKNSTAKTLNPNTSCLLQEEIFGPVVTVTPFETEQEVIDWANGVVYGLSASLWTENGKRQRRVAEALHVGTVWVNCWMVRDLNMPFGGMKHSGVGREGGDYSFEFYTEQKTICLSNN